MRRLLKRRTMKALLGVTLLAIASLMLYLPFTGAMGIPVPQAHAALGQPPEQGGIKYKEVLAPIDSVAIRQDESDPLPRYIVHVVSGLPNGCALFDRYEVVRDGDIITIKVYNLMPADPNILCTMIYRTKDLSVNLGRHFEPGKTYTVKVNDVKKTFTANKIGPAPDVDGRN